MWSPEKNKEDNEPDFEHCVQREGGNRKRGSGSAPQSTYFTVRGQSYFSRLPKYWPPIPLSTRRVCPPPQQRRRGVHTRQAERGMGGQYFGRREKYDCPLTVKYVLCSLPSQLERTLQLGWWGLHRVHLLVCPSKIFRHGNKKTIFFVMVYAVLFNNVCKALNLLLKKYVA